MSKKLLSVKRDIKGKLPFPGKIRFVVQGVTAPLPIVIEAPFRKGEASALLVPSEEYGINSYYWYGIFPQGHAPGIYLHEPVEENYFKMPDHDADLDELIPLVPPQEIPEEIVPEATIILTDIKKALSDARECLRQTCQCKTDLEDMLDNYEELLKERAFLEINQKKEEALQSIQREQDLVNELWAAIQAKFAEVDQIEVLFTQIRELHEAYVREFQQLSDLIASLHIPTKLSDLENDMFDPITNNEINNLY